MNLPLTPEARSLAAVIVFCILGMIAVFWLTACTPAKAETPLIETCADYFVRLEPNSGPMPQETAPPRTLNPPRFSCDPGWTGYIGEAGVVACICGGRKYSKGVQ